MLNLEKSAAAFAEAKTLMPGGVNRPCPFLQGEWTVIRRSIARAEGDKTYDIDGNEYIDYVGSGPMVVGHAHPQVVKALQEAATRGMSYGAPTVIESELAKLVMEVYPRQSRPSVWVIPVPRQR